MSIFLCSACGTSFPESAAPPPHCPICEDERQYIPAAGQGWTTREKLASAHRNGWERHEPDLFSIQTFPAFSINQRAFLIRTPAGNILWDCIPLFDAATEELIDGLGGLAAIAISHPHYYSTMQDWAGAFGAPIYLHTDDGEWIMRPDPAIALWTGETRQILPGVTLIRAGGHFDGGTVLHWAGAGDGQGVLFAGDIVQVTPGAHRVSFMWSYPNMMPLPAAKVRQVAQSLAPWPYQRVYGAFKGQEIASDGPGIIARSAARYIELIGG